MSTGWIVGISLFAAAVFVGVPLLLAVGTWLVRWWERRLDAKDRRAEAAAPAEPDRLDRLDREEAGEPPPQPVPRPAPALIPLLAPTARPVGLLGLGVEGYALGGRTVLAEPLEPASIHDTLALEWAALVYARERALRTDTQELAILEGLTWTVEELDDLAALEEPCSHCVDERDHRPCPGCACPCSLTAVGGRDG